MASLAAQSAAVGALIGLMQGDGGTPWANVGLGALTGATIAFGCVASEFLVFSNPRLRWARRMRPVSLLLVRALAYCLVIAAGLSLPALLSDAPAPWRDPAMPSAFAMSAALAVMFSLGVEVTRMLGREATLALFSGRYDRPRVEERVVLIADIVGSTRTAERIGELRFHEYLGEAALDLAEAIDVTRGEVHRYVGDAVIVTWPLERGVAEGACLDCAERMHALMAAAAPRYLRRFGAEARLRVAIHGGPVAAGEIGDWKKEIALLGDVMNTAARIEGAAKAFDAPTVISDAVARALPEAARAGLVRLPSFVAAGKADDLALWRPAAGPNPAGSPA